MVFINLSLEIIAIFGIDNSFEVLKICFTPHKIQVFHLENLFDNIPIDSLYNVLKGIFDLFYIKEKLNINRDSFSSHLLRLLT